MEQERNPNKNAELSMEQNGNHDRRHHQQSACAAPGGESRWTGCGSTRPSAAAGSVRSVDKKAACASVHLHVMVTPGRAGADRVSAWPRPGSPTWALICGKWPSTAMSSMLTSRTSGSWCPCSGGVPTTSIKWLIHANTYGGIYPEEIADACRRTMPTYGSRCPSC